ncbi:MAG: hypothetical protein HY644_02325 [Acidobacteria bacterium]|nr:hypothetical protein [Acidobacteriota bacterium]
MLRVVLGSNIYVSAFNFDGPPEEILPLAENPDDNRILECSLQAGAQVLITGDQPLLNLDPFRGISIVTGSSIPRLQTMDHASRRVGSVQEAKWAFH